MVSSQPGFLISDKKKPSSKDDTNIQLEIPSSTLIKLMNIYQLESEAEILLSFKFLEKLLTFCMECRSTKVLKYKTENCKGKIRLSKKPMLMPIQSTFTWNVFNQPKGLISLWQGKRSKINIKWKFYSSVNLQIEI